MTRSRLHSKRIFFDNQRIPQQVISDPSETNYVPELHETEVEDSPTLSADALKEALSVYKSINLEANPSQQLMQLLATQKLAEHTKVAYQAKHAFMDDSKTIAEEKDRFGTIKVKLKQDKYLDLAFKEDDVQSRLNLDMPKRPQLKYIQTMLVAPLFFNDQEDLQKILIIGHGGGTIAKYYTDFYPNKSKDIVDIRPLLFDISKTYFNYTPDLNTNFISSDASVFLNKARLSKEKYDLVNIDIFFDGPADVQLTHYFWDNVSNVLSHNGISVANVWKGDHMDKYNKILDNHMSVFNTVFEIPNSETFQVALFGSNIPYEMLMHPNLLVKAIEMSGLTALDFRTHLNNIRRLK